MKEYKMKGITFFITTLFILLTSAPGFAAKTSETYDPQAAKGKAQVCSTCHNIDGNSQIEFWPKIAGQHEKYLLQQMLTFKAGAKGDRFVPAMYGMVGGLSEEDLAMLAHYFSQQTMSPGKADLPKTKLGERIYRGGDRKKGITACASCHGPHGLGNAQANYPKIGGQHAIYTSLQLEAYQKDKRRTDPNALMRDLSKKMNKEL